MINKFKIFVPLNKMNKVNCISIIFFMLSPNTLFSQIVTNSDVPYLVNRTYNEGERFVLGEFYSQHWKWWTSNNQNFCASEDKSHEIEISGGKLIERRVLREYHDDCRLSTGNLKVMEFEFEAVASTNIIIKSRSVFNYDPPIDLGSGPADTYVTYRNSIFVITVIPKPEPPVITPPVITGNKIICPNSSTTLTATCETGTLIWGDSSISDKLYTGALKESTTFTALCRYNGYESSVTSATVTVQNVAVESISHSVIPLDGNLESAILLSSSDNYKICADGSMGSLFTLTGTCLNGVNGKIEQYTNEDNSTETLGAVQLISDQSDSTTQKMIYQHPSRLGADKYEHYSINDLSIYNGGEKITSRKLQIYPAPLMMVHGLWSSEKAFSVMENKLLESNSVNSLYYPSILLHRVDYKNSHDESFQENASVIPNHLNKLLTFLISKGYSVRKADIVGHSMGGILSRLYVQSTSYHNDVNRIIYINTPHSGSQLTDLLLDPRHPNKAAVFNKFILPLFSESNSSSIYNGAIENLRVNSEQIDDVLNSSISKASRVPYHAIVTTRKLSSRPEGVLHQVNPKNLIFEYTDSYLDELFKKDKSDLIVTRTSQWGGTPPPYALAQDHIDEFPGLSHIESTGDNAIIERIRFLLSKPSSSSYFTSDGYDPKNLTYNGLPENVQESREEAFEELFKKQGKMVKPESQLRVQSKQKPYNKNFRINALKLISIDADNNCYVGVISTKGASLRTSDEHVSFVFNAPKVLGKTDLIMLATSETGDVSVQTAHFFVSNNFCESTTSGSWKDFQNWSCGHLPTKNDAVVIKAGHSITIEKSIEGVCSQIDIEFGATLKNQGVLTIKNE